jgi:nucleoporin NUP159
VDVPVDNSEQDDFSEEQSLRDDSFAEEEESAEEATPDVTLDVTKDVASKPLFGEIAKSKFPTFQPPNTEKSPRSPSPVRATPNFLNVNRPDASRSVSAPLAASKLLSRPAALDNARQQTFEASQLEQKARAAQLKKREVDEAQSLVDEEDERMQEFLHRDLDATTRLGEFVAHQDYVGAADKDSIPFQVEAVYRDINSMIDTLGINSRTLACFIKGHTEMIKEVGRERADLQEAEGWTLGELEDLQVLVRKELPRELDDGRLHNSADLVASCQTLSKELSRLRNRAEEVKSIISASRDSSDPSSTKNLPLTAEQTAQQHDLRRSFEEFHKMLVEAEENATVLRAKLASASNAPGVPTVEAVMRTVKKLTAMAEKRSGDVDVLEGQMRRLRMSATPERGSVMRESRFGSPSKMNGRSSLLGSAYGRPTTPQRDMGNGHAQSLSASMRSNGYGTPSRKKIEGFSAEEKERILEVKAKRQVVTNKLRMKLKSSGVRVRAFEDE